MNWRTGSHPAERRVLIASFRVEEALAAAVEDHVDHRRMELAMERLAQLAGLFAPDLRRPEPDAILFELSIAVEADLERISIYRHKQEQRAIFSIPAATLAVRAEETFPGCG